MAGVTQATGGRARLQPGTQGSARWAQRSGFPAHPWMILPCPHPAPSPHTSSPFWEDLGFCPSSPATHLPLTYFAALAQKPFRALADKIGEIESLPTHPAVEAPRLAATCQGQARKPHHSRSSSKDNRSYNSTRRALCSAVYRRSSFHHSSPRRRCARSPHVTDGEAEARREKAGPSARSRSLAQRLGISLRQSTPRSSGRPDAQGWARGRSKLRLGARTYF